MQQMPDVCLQMVVIYLANGFHYLGLQCCPCPPSTNIEMTPIYFHLKARAFSASVLRAEEESFVPSTQSIIQSCKPSIVDKVRLM